MKSPAGCAKLENPTKSKEKCQQVPVTDLKEQGKAVAQDRGASKVDCPEIQKEWVAQDISSNITQHDQQLQPGAGQRKSPDRSADKLRAPDSGQTIPSEQSRALQLQPDNRAGPS